MIQKSVSDFRADLCVFNFGNITECSCRLIFAIALKQIQASLTHKKAIITKPCFKF